MTDSETRQPRFSAIKLIYLREMRDQLRDRRTIFTIAVLPLLVYPLVGMLLLQMAQFTQQAAITVCVVGSDHLPQSPPLVEGHTLVAGLVENSEAIDISMRPWDDVNKGENVTKTCRMWVQNGVFDAVVIVPKGFVGDDDSRETTADREGTAQDEKPLPKTSLVVTSSSEGETHIVIEEETAESFDPTKIGVMFSVASDQSRVAGDRIRFALAKWRGQFVKQNLTSQGIDLEALEPFDIDALDIAPESTRRAAFWSKLLPFVMLVWAMTGAFYPAIDLVAGEKERGTLETLLCSPALRGEIVWGKLLAVTTFSVMTSLLNVFSMQATSTIAFQQMGLGGGISLGAPPISAMFWLLLALLPLSLLFSSLALAVAAMARSSKEGQYYLMPLMMVTLPLVMLPLLPGTTLNLGTSLIPVTGMFMLVRSLVESNYSEALSYLPVVAIVTYGCLHLGVKWAQSQFESEDVLFRDGEQWDLSMWMRHLWRDRQPVATAGQAMMCGIVILMGLFFGRLAAGAPTSWSGLASAVLMPQIGFILAPALLMATMLTTSLRQSLRIRFPQRGAMAGALLLGITLHPLYMQLAGWVSHIIPMSDAAKEALTPIGIMIGEQPLWAVIMLMAAVPAVCEELAFRGFIFAGLARSGQGKLAVIITAMMFGFSHGILQQSISASLMGCVLGWIALRTGSVLPGIVLHVTNNALSVSIGRIQQNEYLYDSWLGFLFDRGPEGEPVYNLMWTVIAGSVAVVTMMYFSLFNDDDADAEEVRRSEEQWVHEREAKMRHEKPAAIIHNKQASEPEAVSSSVQSFGR